MLFFPMLFFPMLFFPIDGDLVHRHLVGVVKLPGAEHPLFGGDIFRWIEVDLVELDLVCTPVVGISLHTEIAVDFPLLKLEGTIAYQVALKGPAGTALVGAAKLFYCWAMDREQTVVIQQLQKVGGRVLQPHLQCMVIQGPDTHLVKVAYFTFIVGFGIFDREVHIGIEIAQGRLQRSPPGPDIVMGIVGITV